jgi:hypothetical protein
MALLPLAIHEPTHPPTHLPTALAGCVARSLIVAARLTRCPVVRRATDTYLCDGNCIATNLCCEDTSLGGCSDDTECDGVATPNGAECVCPTGKAVDVWRCGRVFVGLGGTRTLCTVCARTPCCQ